MHLAASCSSFSSRAFVWGWQPKTTKWCKFWMVGQLNMHDVLVQSSQPGDGRKRQRFDSFWTTQGKSEKYRCFDGAAHLARSAEDVLLEANFYVDTLGSVSVSLSANRLSWQPLEDKLDIGVICCWGPTEDNDEFNQLAISEIYGVESSELLLDNSTLSHPSDIFSGDLFKEVHRFAVHAYKKSSSQKGTWIPKTFVFHHRDQSVCEIWANQIQALLDADIKRPRNLMVFINPHSGKKSASKTWEEVSLLFKRAKINTKVLTTQRSRHAFEVINNTVDEDLEKLDGVVIVGGDGLFNEVLNGLLLRHHRAKLPLRPNDHANSVGSGSLLPPSADLYPLLSSEVTETLSAVSSSSSMQSSHIDLASPILSTTTTCSHASSCHGSPTLDCSSILYKDGGFVIPFAPETCDQLAGQSSGFVFPKPGFRIGIIPAGSTDSIAISTTGSRNVATCALHIIFGEKMPLDIVRLVSWKSTRASAEESPRVRYAASFAGYGFYGDVIKESEPNRWMGPVRYDYAGTKVFFQHKLYDAEISYIELPETDLRTSEPGSSNYGSGLFNKKTWRNGGLNKIACRLNCNICSNGMDFFEMDETSSISSNSENTPKWKHVRGSYISVGAAVISCRNEKAPNGVAASAHLADGLLHLILVKECSRLSYLWHLIQLTREGADSLDFSFVEEYRTPQFNFVSHGEESVWNVDGPDI
ncbi:hypothetical protein GOP47_0026336 [Adiantum capillus-veneris]|nr:hypothetical protein GOP47_0026336 [Adiantum capillus-veneris]